MRVLPWDTPEARGAARQPLKAHLDAGGLLVYPTETVYGLGCTLHYESLELLAGFKGRRPFLLLIRDRECAPDLEWTDDAVALAEAFWPGPLTLALTAGVGRYPAQVLGSGGAVAVRVSSHPGAPDLLDTAGGPVTSTSANAPGDPPAREGETARAVGEAVSALGADVLVLDGGTLPPGEPSTLVRCDAHNHVIREGAIPRKAVGKVVRLT